MKNEARGADQPHVPRFSSLKLFPVLQELWYDGIRLSTCYLPKNLLCTAVSKRMEEMPGTWERHSTYYFAIVRMVPMS